MGRYSRAPQPLRYYGEEPPKTADDYRREIAAWLRTRPKRALSTAAEFMREQARRMGRRDPEPDPMPADLFNGITEAALAQVAMIEAVRESGLSEPSALFYVACLRAGSGSPFSRAASVTPAGAGADV